ncbi:MAG TPA: hypothetical protein VFJ64_05165 [Solirubrobacterales bacterium]|nr:hypothetical protein [Solirubrobacterales bacterium]
MLKRHLNPATVIACIALFVALGGAAVAAKTASKNSVKTASIANGAVTTAKIRNGAVTTGKLRNGGVTGEKIAPATIGSSQLASGSVRSGQLGGQVVTEPKIKNGAVSEAKLGTGAVSSGKLAPTFLAQLLRNVTYVTETSPNDSEEEKSVTAKCPAGKETIGGGARINSPAKVAVAINASYPLVDSNNGRVGWIAGGRETSAEAETWQVVAYAVCAEL